MINRNYIAVLMCSLFLSNVSFGQKSTVVTNAGDVGLTMSNVGFLGNSFRGNFQLENEPSCEFPINSGVEHLLKVAFGLALLYVALRLSVRLRMIMQVAIVLVVVVMK